MYKAKEQRFTSKYPTSRRKPEGKSLYGRAWQAARKSFLNKNPLCVVCKAVGVVKSATHADHIIPHRGNKTLFWDKNNWQALCANCHSKKTNTQDGGFGNKTAAAKAEQKKKYERFGNIHLGDNDAREGGYSNFQNPQKCRAGVELSVGYREIRTGGQSGTGP